MPPKKKNKGKPPGEGSDSGARQQQPQQQQPQQQQPQQQRQPPQQSEAERPKSQAGQQKQHPTQAHPKSASQQGSGAGSSQGQPRQQPQHAQQKSSQAALPPGFHQQQGQPRQPIQHVQAQSFPAALPPGFPGWGVPASAQKQTQQLSRSQEPAPFSTSEAQQNPSQPKQQAAAQAQKQDAPPKKVKGNKYPKKEQLPPSEPSPSTSQAAASDLPQEMEHLKLSPTKALVMIESSPDGSIYQGKNGRKVSLEVNYLQILVNNLIPKAFHYDVEFIPDVPKKLLPAALDEFMKNFFPNVKFAFDGRKNFYTNQLLAVKSVPLEDSYEQEVNAVLRDRSRKFKVKVQFATEVDMTALRGAYKLPAHQHNDKPSQAIQCLDVILRTAFKQSTANNEAVAVSRALYFATQGRPMDLGEGMELWLGLFQSAVLGRTSLYLNVDVAHKAFPSKISVLQVLASFDRDGNIPHELNQWQQSQLHDYLKMLSISYSPSQNHQPKTYGYNALVSPPGKATFVLEDGRRMTVLEYFEGEKRIRLRYPGLPCLHVGSKVRNVYVPLEFCTIPAGQATNKKCTPNCVAKMIKYSATSTDDRKRKILELLNKINYATPNGDIKGFGIDVDKKFQSIDGRVIDAPKIKYNNTVATPKNGVWNGGQYLETQGKLNWAIINCDDRTNLQSILELKRNILSESRKLGMGLADSHGESDYFKINMMRPKPDEMKQLLLKCFNQGYKLVFVIIIDKNDCYAKVKQAAELEVGIMTQCIKANTIFRMGKGNPMMTIGNILLKVNAKLNGKNHEVQENSYSKMLGGGVMFVGADVTHPSPDQRDIPSVVGVAASYDDVGFRYQCSWRLQDPKKEMIEDLKAILTGHLQYYQSKNNNTLPGRIMYYRDGVSEGQFKEVLEIEMTAIRGAMQAVYKQNAPAKVTFVVVQKRHHTRFFPKDRQSSDAQFGGRNNNILAGTVVDKDIVHPFQYQFFMASHAAIQGVTKPTKYCVLVNESKIPADHLQAITYDLCHLFTRCNRSVSYPAPTYYAHLVAARGKQYIIGAHLDMRNLQREFDRRVIRPNFINNTPMFFV